MNTINPLEVKALGRVASLGTLYDARKGTFCENSISSFAEISCIPSIKEINNNVVKVVDFQTSSSPFEALGVSENGNYDALAKSPTSEFYHRFLLNEINTLKSTLKTGLCYSSQKERKDIDVRGIELKGHLQQTLLRTNATHFVMSIIYGHEMFITLCCDNILSSEKNKVSNELKRSTDDLACILNNSSNSFPSYCWNEKLIIDVFGVPLLPVRFNVNAFETAAKYIEKKVTQINSQETYPLTYVMFELRRIVNLPSKPLETFHSLNQDQEAVKRSGEVGSPKKITKTDMPANYVKITGTPEVGSWEVENYAPLFISCPASFRREWIDKHCRRIYCRRRHREWTCFHCKQTVMCGIDGFLYCSCGRIKPSILPSTHTFKCQDRLHGTSFKYLRDLDDIEAIAEGLSQNTITTKEYINILLLGQTGVGKTTFINALANYLRFDTLQNAVNKRPEYPIPSNFTVIDEASQIGTVHFGEDLVESLEDKCFAAQAFKSFTFPRGEKMVRLVNTPSIGDTGDEDQDQKHMLDIVQYISHYTSVHGICFFLTANHPHLMDKFKSLLLYVLEKLGKRICKNIVFVFTNSANNFFRPGETFSVLGDLLSDVSENDPEIEIELTTNYYCLDNEAFRYLVLKDQNKCLEFERGHARYEQSWKKSSDESKRMIQNICNLPPFELVQIGMISTIKQVTQILRKPLATAMLDIQNEMVKMEIELQKINANVKNKVTEGSLSYDYFLMRKKEEQTLQKNVCLLREEQHNINRIRAHLTVPVRKHFWTEYVDEI